MSSFLVDLRRIGNERRKPARYRVVLPGGRLHRADIVSRQVRALLADARNRGNWYIATELCTLSNFVWLAADDPDEGERVTIESIGR
jgi:hypothetical protein